jgi:hypothetical protein
MCPERCDCDINYYDDMLDGLFTYVEIYRSENGDEFAYPCEQELKVKAAAIYWELRELVQCCRMYPDVELPPCIADDIHQLCRLEGFFSARFLAQNSQQEEESSDDDDKLADKQQENTTMEEDSADEETRTVIPSTLTMSMTMTPSMNEEEDASGEDNSVVFLATGTSMNMNEEAGDDEEDASTVAMMAPEDDLSTIVAEVAVATKILQSTMTQFYCTTSRKNH